MSRTALLALLLSAACGAAEGPAPSPPEMAVAEISNVAEPAATVPVAASRCADAAGDPVNPPYDERKDQANRQFDQQDFEGARDTAAVVLAEDPCDVRMRRVHVSASCVLGDPETARAFWIDLPEHDREQIARRCSRYGIALEP